MTSFHFFSAFLVFVVVFYFYKGLLYHIMCDFRVWLGLKTHLVSPLFIVLALFYHSVPQQAEESSVPPCCHVSPHCTTAIIAV